MTERSQWDAAPDHAAADSDDFDEIDGRAAELLARMAAQRNQRPADDLAPTRDFDVAHEPDPIAELEPIEEPALHAQWPDFGPDEPSALDADESPATRDVAPLEPEPPAATEPDRTGQAPEPPAADPAEDPLPDFPQRPPAAKRMALPPWQSGPPAPVPDFEAPTETPSRLPAPADEQEPTPAAALEPPPAEPPALPPAWPPPGMPMPQPGWGGVPPGWPPAMPPPPNWPGAAAWGVAPEYWPPDRPGADAAERPRPEAESSGGLTRRGRSAPPEPDGGDYLAAQAYRTPPSLDEAEILERTPEAPASGWRRAVHKATGGLVNPGSSRKERERKQLLEQIRQPIVGDFRIAVLSIKGGVGKTTTAIALGSSLAMVRTDRVVAVDANPDRGTLAERVLDTSNHSTVRDLLRDPNIHRYADVRNYTRMSPNRLEVLASEQDPAVAEVFGEEDYRRTIDILRHYYNIILTDCGTGIMHSAMAGVLDLANTIVLVSSPAIDAARSASATLDWLTQHGYEALVRQAHVVFSASKPGSPDLNVDKVIEHFAARCHSTHLIPFDPHLAEGADFDLDLLKPATAEAYLELAGAVSERFSPFARPQPVR
jgi:MinD-like ATPase involved in chromosome partitioning or flagellar assembly